MTDDITARFHGGDEFSEAANPSERKKLRDRARIRGHIRGLGETGATCEEVEDALGMSHQSASARISELRRDGLLGENGRRMTRSGRSARVHVVTSTDDGG